MKDNSSVQAKQYAKYRPTYPASLYDFILSHVPVKEKAWDCATGNGQVAGVLSKHFDSVYATDISAAQINNAIVADNIFYKVEPAEETTFQDNSFDLITVGQAIHWFDFDKFYNEATRTLKTGGIVVLLGYDLLRLTPALNKVICTFYNYILGIYWDKERKYIDEQYKTLPFPFAEVNAPSFTISYEWEFDELTGFFNTWSAVQHFIRINNYNPLDLVIDDFKEAWGPNKTHVVNFPLILRMGQVNK